jgi:uncharacterized membrane protein YeaQ/YmgE (transglycosylase-associated protein family)
MNRTRTAGITGDEDSSLAAKWWHSAAAQGFALGFVLGPVGALLAYLFSAQHNRAARSFAALKGSVVASVLILLVLGIVLFAV